MELLTIIVATVSCGAFFLVMLTLFVVLHKNDLCCSSLQGSEDYWEEAVHYSVQSLISHVSSSYPFIHRAAGSQSPRDVFVVGKPSHYHLCETFPRLPSYDTVRRTDRQGHSLIPQRLWLGPDAQPPPSYEVSMQLPQDVPTVDLHPLFTENHQPRLHQDNLTALE